ncbi:UDP-3-O-(3-hydroxymyristoyl)glucosamine N-acyltransferase [Paenalcaligenes niemegkensis]|uniref:UDP-3-O-(3-hydroxymyristoyl)glucosamine N-acyltransferase n=1 Tax=Paenalcaligenes niemegkensis TaxID=2895469 RepID=UPI001EE7CDA2|nr:UDP-3-O-(3-hydroxymyristoyl)glucosamine N-acyltransferase [Paenalcaligenes niemegkensis]MCQ9616293.1 UDP-3-O-(3-hydroxymyristoyl)glucosamine N-acyltransferase [Paenalcaligenes niemegkensis]
MPVLLAPDQAPSLEQLIAVVQSTGLECSLANISSEPTHPIQGLGSLLYASSVELSFLSNPKLKDQLSRTQAGAVILSTDDYRNLTFKPHFAVVLCDQPYLMYALLAQWFDRHRIEGLPAGIHPSATIHSSAVLHDGVSVAANAVIEANVVVGQGTRIGAGCVVGENSTIGTSCLLHAKVVLYHQVSLGDRCIVHAGAVIGADGFGFAPDPSTQGAWAKIAQIGGVQIGDDVEIGANTTIDRGALDNTVIENGVKLDNQIMVAHNVRIGEHTAIAACVGIAGSTVIGKRCIIGGAAMLSGHITLTDDVQVSGGTAITSNVDQPGRYTGVYPYAEHQQWQRNAAVISQLNPLRRRLRALERGNND